MLGCERVKSKQNTEVAMHCIEVLQEILLHVILNYEKFE